MIGTTINIEERVTRIEDALERAAAGQDPVVFVNEALGGIGDLAFSGFTRSIAGPSKSAICALLEDVKPLLAHSVIGKIASSDVYEFLDAARELVGLMDDRHARKCLLQVGLLKGNLTRLVLLRELATLQTTNAN
ncbi:hypothetical protein DXM27_06185 [Rhizobium rhizogenes]|uniref:Uncharacterized protein n=1 Tax=Rhizobium rhizogenes TaxID=359 RepID=A0AA88JQ88_RHIRH|nr:hypothetical protein [Rhizobium rhizogenes]KAA3502577.1 hypothetical protein DXM27_06185 [Rhizobium rhizogenes]